MKSKENLSHSRTKTVLDLAKFSLNSTNNRLDSSGNVSNHHTSNNRLNALTSAAFNTSNEFLHDSFQRGGGHLATMAGQITPVGPFHLQLGPNITSHPFVNASFTIPLFLYDGNRELVQGYEIPIQAELFYHQADNSLSTADDICALNPSPVVIGPLGVVEIHCRFSQLSMQHSNRRFVWKFSLCTSVLQQQFTTAHSTIRKNPSSIEDNANNDAVISIMTPAFLVVRQRLKISVSSGCNAQLAQAAEVLAASNNPNSTTTNSTEDWIQNPTIQTILNNTGNGHIIWYKDEGGKDHGLDVVVSLIDAKSEQAASSSQQVPENNFEEKEYKPVLGYEVPFVFQLVYSNGDTILGCSPLPLSKSLISSSSSGNGNANSSTGTSSANNPALSNASSSIVNMMPLSASTNALFSILPDGNACFIDKNTGKTTPRLKIRIHDISKNHQRQLFRLKVMPDIAQCPGLFDVAGDESLPIEVRSKRTKRQRDALILLMQQQQKLQQQKVSISKSPSMVNVHLEANNTATNNAKNVLHHIPTITVPDDVDSQQEDPRSSVSPLVELSPLHPTAKAEESFSFKKRLISDISADNTKPPSFMDEGSDNAHHDLTTSKSKRTRTSNTSGERSINSSSVEHVDTLLLGDNMPINNVLARWIQQTVQTMQHIRWQPLGYQTLPDGSVDSHNLLYRMTNPNEYLDNLLEEYEAYIHPLLQQQQRLPTIINNDHLRSDNRSNSTNRNNTSRQAPSTAPVHAGHTNMSNSSINNNNNNNNSNVSSKIRTKKFGRVGRDTSSSQPIQHTYHHTSNESTSTGLLSNNLPTVPYFGASQSSSSSAPFPHPLSSSYMHHVYPPAPSSSLPAPFFSYPYGDPRFHGNNQTNSYFHPPASTTSHHSHWQNSSDMSFTPTYPLFQSNSAPANSKNLKPRGGSKRESNTNNDRPSNHQTETISSTVSSGNNNNSSSSDVSRSFSSSTDEARVFTIVSSPLRLLCAYVENNLKNSSEDIDDAFLQPLLEIEALQIPAFDTRNQLVGFYSETKDESTSATILQFIPVSESVYVQFAMHYKSVMNATEFLDYVRQEANRFFEEMSVSRTDDIFALSRNGEYDLENMKQDAMVHFWFAAVGLSDEF